MKNAYKIVFSVPEGKTHIERLMHVWENNVNNRMLIGFYLAQVRV
jgi:hypothetical protein